MKYLSPALLFFLFTISCQKPSKIIDSTNQSTRDALTGAWRMTDFLQITNEGDTIKDDDRVQYKMYVDGSVMWGFESPKKFTEWYGYGTYQIEGDSLYETMTSGSWAFRQAISQNNNFFRIGIDIDDSTYTQVIKEKNHISYETYKRVN